MSKGFVGSSGSFKPSAQPALKSSVMRAWSLSGLKLVRKFSIRPAINWEMVRPIAKICTVRLTLIRHLPLGVVLMRAGNALH